MTKISRMTPTIPRRKVAVAKKSDTGFPRPRSHTARRTSGRAAISIYIVTVIGAVKSPNLLRVPPDSICSFYLNGDLLGAIAQAAFKGADVRPVWPRYHAVSIIGPWHFGHGGRSISTGRDQR
jgi:hypothetical protein